MIPSHTHIEFDDVIYQIARHRVTVHLVDDHLLQGVRQRLGQGGWTNNKGKGRRCRKWTESKCSELREVLTLQHNKRGACLKCVM